MNIVVSQSPKNPELVKPNGYDSIEISGRNEPNGGQDYASIQIKASQKPKAPVDPDAGVFGTDLRSALNDLLGNA